MFIFGCRSKQETHQTSCDFPVFENAWEVGGGAEDLSYYHFKGPKNLFPQMYSESEQQGPT